MTTLSLTDIRPYVGSLLCTSEYRKAYWVFGPEPRPVAEFAAAYVAAYPEKWRNIVRVAAALSRDRAWIWQVARIAFEPLPSPINEYATTLGPANWRAAVTAAGDAAAGKYACRAASGVAARATLDSIDDAVDAAPPDADADTRNRIIAIAVNAINARLAERGKDETTEMQ
mgnify:CR=1 FL=1